MLAVLVLACPAACAFALGGAPPAAGRRSAALRLQTIAPEREKTSDLPTTWEVPDTFSFASLGSAEPPEPPMCKLTVFKTAGADEVRMANILRDVIKGLELERAKEIAKTCNSLGFAMCGIWAEAVAADYAKGLQGLGLRCDVTEV